MFHNLGTRDKVIISGGEGVLVGGETGRGMDEKSRLGNVVISCLE